MKCAVSGCCYFLRHKHSNALCVSYYLFRKSVTYYIYFKTSIKMPHNISSFSSMPYDTIYFALLHNCEVHTKYKITNKGTDAIHCHFKATAWIIRATVSTVFSVVGSCNFMPCKFSQSFSCPSFSSAALRVRASLSQSGALFQLPFPPLPLLPCYSPPFSFPSPFSPNLPPLHPPPLKAS